MWLFLYLFSYFAAPRCLRVEVPATMDRTDGRTRNRERGRQTSLACAALPAAALGCHLCSGDVPAPLPHQCCGFSAVCIFYKHLPACSVLSLGEVVWGEGNFLSCKSSTKEVHEQSYRVVMVITVISKLPCKIA